MKKSLLILVIACCLVFALTGCTKDEILGTYNDAIQAAGDAQLTSNRSLEGKRKYGVDHYTGTYDADYEDFSGTEYLFGGTSIDREAGNEIEITCNLNITDGSAKLVLQSGADDPQILIESTGDYSETIELPPAGNYIVVECDDFTGSIELEIK
ncbi:hypothetical protein Psfp_01499 [Pelotomaculum sp. FP]|uniref:hypothetical protein n=1 Tax=Pelotomaculum sp. FP TaxID=261474 RepID=UPI001066855F|nr:hypothetical protein [Pelotomaculum sp. FP]TEB16272.1 hypothetical protein Psfp_01499 [Pelotomaculum sp. FP]